MICQLASARCGGLAINQASIPAASVCAQQPRYIQPGNASNATLQVVFMTATRAEILERVKWRRVDCDHGCEPFHVPPEPEPPAKGGKGAPPPPPVATEAPLLPMTPEGAVDEVRAARLQPRHDDSQENVLRRLELWDLYFEEVRSRWLSPHLA